jgi:hypothetical protein
MRSIYRTELIGLRDRALIGLMVFSFGCVGAVNTLRVGDYFANEERWWSFADSCISPYASQVTRR